MAKKLFATSDSVALTFLRLGLGVVFFAHGSQMVLGWFGGSGFSGTMSYFTGLGLPAVIAFLIIIGEFFGSLGLLTGFLTRIAAAGIGIIMLGAVFMVHLPNGFFMNWYGNKQGEGYEYHILVLAICLALLIAGGGRFSVDRALAER